MLAIAVITATVTMLTMIMGRWVGLGITCWYNLERITSPLLALVSVSTKWAQ